MGWVLEKKSRNQAKQSTSTSAPSSAQVQMQRASSLILCPLSTYHNGLYQQNMNKISPTFFILLSSSCLQWKHKAVLWIEPLNKPRSSPLKCLRVFSWFSLNIQHHKNNIYNGILRVTIGGRSVEEKKEQELSRKRN